MSGTVLVRWALSEKGKDEDTFNMFALGKFAFVSYFSRLSLVLILLTAHELGHSASNSDELVAFLLQIPAEELILHTSHPKGN